MNNIRLLPVVIFAVAALLVLKTLGLMTNGLNLFGVSPFMRGVLTGVLLLAAVSLQRRRIVGM